jgi:serine/threonine-protein kinase
MPLAANQGVEVALPNFMHLTIAHADSLAKDLGLELKRAGTRVDDDVLPGYVVDQSPAPGLTVKKGRNVDVVLSIRSERILCPNLIGRDPSDAQLIADSAGLKINEKNVTYQFSNSSPEGVVMSQLPKPAESVNKGEPIALVVSLGREPRDNEIVAPSLVGRMLDEIKVLLQAHKVQLGEVVPIPDIAPINTILSQDPPPGKKMVKDGKVNLKVSTGAGGDSTKVKSPDKTATKKAPKAKAKKKK